MAIARLRKRLADRDWIAVVIDVLVVLVGVFLGLQANNWNEARLDRARARSYHARLIEDLRQTERGAEASVRYYRDVRDHALAALAGFDRSADTLDAQFLVDLFQATQQWPRTGRRPTYDEIMASGHVELIGPPALRERLSNFYWRMEGLLPSPQPATPLRMRVRGLIPYPVQAMIRASCDDVMTDLGNGLVTIRLPRTCTIAPPDPQVRAGIAAVRAAPGLENDLTGTLADLDWKLLNFGKLAAGAREMRGILERSAP